MAGRTSSLEQLQVINDNIYNNNFMDFSYLRLWSIGLWVPVSLVHWWRKMTTNYSSPYKVGLIDVGTKFAQSRLAWSGIAYGKWNFHGNVVSVKRFVANATLHRINQPK